MVFRGLTEQGTAKPPKSAQFGQFWRFGRALLGQPSEVHEATNFLGINYCSTYKKASKNPHIINICCWSFTISEYQRSVQYDLSFNYVKSYHNLITAKIDQNIHNSYFKMSNTHLFYSLCLQNTINEQRISIKKKNSLK